MTVLNASNILYVQVRSIIFSIKVVEDHYLGKID